MNNVGLTQDEFATRDLSGFENLKGLVLPKSRQCRFHTERSHGAVLEEVDLELDILRFGDGRLQLGGQDKEEIKEVLMNIRRATIDDSAGIAGVQIGSYRTAYAGILPQPYLDQFDYHEQSQDWRDLLSGAMSDLLYVAISDKGEVTGYVLGRAMNRAESGFDCEIAALHVRKSSQRQGIGRRLMAAVADNFQQQGCQSLMLSVLTDNANARQFYERIGGQLVPNKEIRFAIDGQEFTEVVYGWEPISKLIL